MDRAAEAAAELGPVLARLAEAQSGCAWLLQEARRDAEETRARTREQAAGLLASARARAEGERADAAARARARAGAESTRLIAEAERQAAAMGQLAEQRLPDYVARVVAAVRAIGEEAPAAAQAGQAR